MKPRLALACALAAILGGCDSSTVRFEDIAVKLDVGEIYTLSFDATIGDRALKVSASSPGATVDVHIYLKEHEEEIERSITLGKKPENVLASRANAEEITLEATIPANKKPVVRFYPAGNRQATVQVARCYGWYRKVGRRRHDNKPVELFTDWISMLTPHQGSLISHSRFLETRMSQTDAGRVIFKSRRILLSP